MKIWGDLQGLNGARMGGVLKNCKIAVTSFMDSPLSSLHILFDLVFISFVSGLNSLFILHLEIN